MMFDYLNTEGLIHLWEKIKNKLLLKQDVITDLDEIRDGAAKGATALQEHQDISGKVDKQDGYGLISDADAEQITTNKNAINVLNGSGEGSVSKAVADEIAKVVAKAPDDFDTLKEISDWISGHENDASAMNSAIQENAADIESIEADLATKITSADIPQNVSAFNNDAGYLTERQSLNGYATEQWVEGKGYLTQHQSLDGKQDKLSAEQLANINSDHSKYLTSRDISDKADASSLATVATSGSYNDLADKPTIPTVPKNVSAFNNDRGYLTEHQDISGKADKSNTYTKSEVDAIAQSSGKVKTVNNIEPDANGNIAIEAGGHEIVDEVPAPEDAKDGVVYFVEDEGNSPASETSLAQVVTSLTQNVMELAAFKANMFTTASTTVNVSNGSTVTAPTVNGYKFLCWLQPASIGWIGQAYCNSALDNPTTVYGFANDRWDMNNNSVRFVALYVKNS